MKIVSSILIVLLIGLVIGCSGEKSSDKATDNLTDTIIRPDSELQMAKIQLYTKGEVVAEINADKMVKFESIDSTMAYILEIDILDSLGETSTDIVGDSGVIREVKGVIHIYGNVVVITEDGTKLETEYLWWDSNTDRIKSDAFVKITTEDNDIVTGWGLDADNQLNSFKILNQVSGEVKDPEKLEKSE